MGSSFSAHVGERDVGGELSPMLRSALMDDQQMIANAPGYWINLIAQDDHAIDYIKPTIWFD